MKKGTLILVLLTAILMMLGCQSFQVQKEFDQKVAAGLEAKVAHDGRVVVILPENAIQYHQHLFSCLYLEDKPWKELAKRVEFGWDKKEVWYEAAFHSKNTQNPSSFEFIGPKDALLPDERNPWFKPAKEIEYSFRHPSFITTGTLQVDTAGW